ncbi:chitin synthase III catalytic subunit [Lactarius sanguifluus]|nr:chitin synthase III catalytic subunit [Lactarius sanguifluus]
MTRDVPSYPWCNLFYREVCSTFCSNIVNVAPPAALLGASFDTKSAPVGINPKCGIPRTGSENSIGNVANIIACAFSIVVTLWLIYRCTTAKAAVGRVELRAFLVVYLFTLPLQLVTTGSFLQQGQHHPRAVAALFWTLLGNAIVATQVVEDGTPSSLIPFYFLTVVFMAATTYPGNPKDSLHSITLFVLTSIWPGAAALVYFILMGWIVAAVLREMRPLIYYGLAGLLFILAQLAFFLLSRPICNGTNAKIDGSFIATVLDTATVVVLYLAWRSITEGMIPSPPYYWVDEAYFPR